MTAPEQPLFRVLVLDDESHVHTRAERELNALKPSVEVIHAKDIDEAANIITATFVHVAFVDLHLKAGSGITFIRDLTIRAPTCKVVIITKYTQQFADDVLSLVGSTPSLVGIMNKLADDDQQLASSQRYFAPFVTPMLAELKRQSVVLDGLDGPDGAIAAIVAKRKRIDGELERAHDLARLRDSDTALRDELQFILRGVFGRAVAPIDGQVTHVNLRLLRKGYSSSVVLEAVPSIPVAGLDSPVEGNRCIVKVGPRPDILTEAQRYEQVVKFGVALDYRVELLGTSTGDALAAVCYSFAGSRTSPLTSLDELFGEPEGNTVCREVFNQMFAKSASNWYSIIGEATSLEEYFAREYHVLHTKSLEKLDQWLDSLADKQEWIKIRHDRSREAHLALTRSVMVCKKFKLTLPRRAMLASAGLSDPVQGSLIHGDLHGGNIMVDQSQKPPRFRFIDYRNSGFGPRLLDLAALQASIRLAHADQIIKDGPNASKPSEEAVARICADSFNAENRLLLPGRLNEQWWVQADRSLRDARMVNFPDASDSEALWTSFAYCLNMFRIVNLEWHRKLRLLLWLAAVTDRLAVLEAADGADDD